MTVYLQLRLNSPYFRLLIGSVMAVCTAGVVHLLVALNHPNLRAYEAAEIAFDHPATWSLLFVPQLFVAQSVLASNEHRSGFLLLQLFFWLLATNALLFFLLSGYGQLAILPSFLEDYSLQGSTEPPSLALLMMLLGIFLSSPIFGLLNMFYPSDLPAWLVTAIALAGYPFVLAAFAYLARRLPRRGDA